MKNITLAMDEAILEEVRIVAAKKGDDRECDGSRLPDLGRQAGGPRRARPSPHS